MQPRRPFAADAPILFFWCFGTLEFWQSRNPDFSFLFKLPFHTPHDNMDNNDASLLLIISHPQSTMADDVQLSTAFPNFLPALN
jgi:hypothetical protein